MPFRTAPERPCPGCGEPIPVDGVRCTTCGYGHRPAPGEAPAKRHRTLFRENESPVAKRLAREFRCPQCRSFGAKVRMLSMTGGIEMRHLGAGAQATCRFCGAMQFFDLDVYERSPRIRWELLGE